MKLYFYLKLIGKKQGNRLTDPLFSLAWTTKPSLGLYKEKKAGEKKMVIRIIKKQETD